LPVIVALLFYEPKTVAGFRPIASQPCRAAGRDLPDCRAWKCRRMNVNISHSVINEHAPIFYELIELVTDCLQSKGVDVSYTKNQVDARRVNLIVGHTMFLSREIFTQMRSLTDDYIVFQLEALDKEQGFSAAHPAYFDFLRGAKQVWDYSPRNTQYLDGIGIANVRHIPLGYSPRLARIVDAREQDIDVLFFGIVTPRRLLIMNELHRAGFETALLTGVYGPARDSQIGRAKIVVNIHQFDTSQLEHLRITYLLNNKRFVISEKSENHPYGDGVVFCDYKDIVPHCAHYLGRGMKEKRARIAKSGHECLKRIPMAKSMINALKELA
jgi:hypothetical protein